MNANLEGPLATLRKGPQIGPYLRLTRPPETLFVFVGTLIGAHLAGVAEQSLGLLLAVATSNMLLSAASMVINDWHDVAEDSINRPDRPISSGRIHRDRAKRFFISLFASAILIAAVADLRIGGLAVLVTFLSVQYSLRWKKTPYWGNTIVAVSFSYIFWCWIPLIDDYNAAYVVLTLAFFLFNAGREIVKTGGDVVGDGLCGVRTVATCQGVASAHRIGSCIVLCAVLLAWLPGLSRPAQSAYAGILTLTTTLGGWVVARSWLEPNAGHPDSSERYLKVIRTIQALMAVAILTGIPRP